MLPPSRKGVRLTVEHRLAIGRASKGNQNCLGRAPWNKGKVLPHLRGENAGHWKGGHIKHPDKRERKAVEYREWREAVFKRDDWTCQKCGERGGKLQADHIKSFAEFPELRLKLSNGRTLCVKCHKKTENYGRRGKKVKVG